MKEVMFDRRGITQQCPIHGEALSFDCVNCRYCLATVGFKCYCDYPDATFNGEGGNDATIKSGKG